jgi:hypothetical protein
MHYKVRIFSKLKILYEFSSAGEKNSSNKIFIHVEIYKRSVLRIASDKPCSDIDCEWVSMQPYLPDSTLHHKMLSPDERPTEQPVRWTVWRFHDPLATRERRCTCWQGNSASGGLACLERDLSEARMTASWIKVASDTVIAPTGNNQSATCQQNLRSVR